MKPFLSLVPILVGSVLLVGCASEGEPLVQEAGSDLQRGISGQGALYEQNKEDDPFIRDSSER